MGWYPCCCAQCELCSGGSPSQWQVVVSGILNGTCLDGTCNTYNGTYFLSFNSGGPALCRWSIPVSFAGCAAGPTFVGLTIFPALLIVQFESPGGGYATWSEVIAAPFNCLGYSGHSVPPAASANLNCDASLSTCLITAIP